MNAVHLMNNNAPHLMKPVILINAQQGIMFIFMLILYQKSQNMKTKKRQLIFIKLVCYLEDFQII